MNTSKLEADLRGHLDALLRWVNRNGFAGWDPYDVWDTQIGSWATAKPQIGRRIVRLALSRTDEVCPLVMRRLLGAKPAVNAKGMGLFAAAFLRMEALDTSPPVAGEPGYIPCFRWLDANYREVNDGIGWGYPFNWQSRVYIPRGTPTVVNSSVIGDAYWHYYKQHDAMDALTRCEAICRFIIGGLNRSAGTSGTFCFSYTPLDHMEVHNANLFGAEFLVRIGAETGRAEWVETGLAAAHFSLGQIRDDGTLSYWSDTQSASAPQQDTYHAGFEIRALHGIAQTTGLDVFRSAAVRYFDTWRTDYFEPDGTPCFQRGSRGVVEVHSLAESLLCAARMHADGVLSDDSFLEIVGPAFAAGRDALWVTTDDDSGYFARIRRRRYGTTMRMEIPFIRWGQAWMAAAMAAALERVSSIMMKQSAAGPA